MTAEHHRSAWRYLSRRYAGWRWLPLRVALRVALGMRSMLASRVPTAARVKALATGVPSDVVVHAGRHGQRPAGKDRRTA